MNFIIRLIQRTVVTVIVISVIWFITTQIFFRLDEQVHVFLAAFITYVFSAYILLPRVVHMTIILLRKGRVPQYTRAADGLSADPVNIIFFGTEVQLVQAFEQAGWYKADPLTPKTAWKMMLTFLQNKQYVTAPFSSLYLFARRQDQGFEEPIGLSPRRRHHIRFWAANTDQELDIHDISFWNRTAPVDMSKPLMWIGAGTKDIGFGLTKLTYQLSHRIEKTVDAERDHITAELSKVLAIRDLRLLESGSPIIGRYVSDGKIAVARLS